MAVFQLDVGLRLDSWNIVQKADDGNWILIATERTAAAAIHRRESLYSTKSGQAYHICNTGGELYMVAKVAGKLTSTFALLREP